LVEVDQLLRAYYHALAHGAPLDGFYATDEEAGALGPVVKIGSGKNEVFVGHASIASAVDEVTRTITENRLESRGPRMVRAHGDLAWLVDTAWWGGRSSGAEFASLSRWTAICLRTSKRGWRFLQVHVSEEVE